MHELSIVQALTEQVEIIATKEHARSVVRVVIAVGAFSGVDAEALRSLFPLVAEETVAANAELVIEQVSGRIKCRACGHEAQADAELFIGCAACGSRDGELSAGRELNIKSVELEVEERQVAYV